MVVVVRVGAVVGGAVVVMGAVVRTAESRVAESRAATEKAEGGGEGDDGKGGGGEGRLQFKRAETFAQCSLIKHGKMNGNSVPFQSGNEGTKARQNGARHPPL